MHFSTVYYLVDKDNIAILKNIKHRILMLE